MIVDRATLERVERLLAETDENLIIGAKWSRGDVVRHRGALLAVRGLLAEGEENREPTPCEAHQAVIDADRAVIAAKAERARVLAAALDNGATCRSLAAELDAPTMNVWRWAGRGGGS
jgi:hypothetical protein